MVQQNPLMLCEQWPNYEQTVLGGGEKWKGPRDQGDEWTAKQRQKET